MRVLGSVLPEPPKRGLTESAGINRHRVGDARAPRACLKHGVNRFVFRSSATVYGENEVPFVEM